MWSEHVRWWTLSIRRIDRSNSSTPAHLDGGHDASRSVRAVSRAPLRARLLLGRRVRDQRTQLVQTTQDHSGHSIRVFSREIRGRVAASVVDRGQTRTREYFCFLSLTLKFFVVFKLKIFTSSSWFPKLLNQSWDIFIQVGCENFYNQLISDTV